MTFQKTTLLLLLLLTTPAFAESISEVDKTLKKVEESLSESQGGAAKLDKTLQATKTEIKRIEGDTKTIAKRIKSTETDSVKLREKLAELTARRDELETKVKALKATLAPMIQAALDMANTPTDLNLFLEDPNTAGNLLTAHVALSGAASSAQKHLEHYAVARSELDALQRDIAAEQSKLDKLLDSLADDRKELVTRMDEQSKLAKTTETDLAGKQQDIKKLQAEREKLATLLNTLKSEEIERKRKAAEARRKREEERRQEKSSKPFSSKPKPAPPKKKREKTIARGLPASGYVVQHYGDADPDSGLESQGIRIEGEPGGLVTSPVSGQVRYAGNFRGLGNLVIIEDSGGDFSLLGELGRISTREGAKLAKGAPVGTLSTSTNPSPQLYYELRRNGKTPVDPMSLF